MPTQSIGREVLHHNRSQRRWKEVPERTKSFRGSRFAVHKNNSSENSKGKCHISNTIFLNYEGDIIIYI